MPNILLFGCDRGLIERLVADSRWNVAIGVHAKDVSPRTPDPRHWNLIVDDCEKQGNVNVARDDLPEVARYNVTYEYLREAERAHAIRLCGGDIHLEIQSVTPTGHKELEFNPRDDSAQHLVDFIDLFEDRFAATRLAEFNPFHCTTIFADTYGETLVEFHRAWGLPCPFLCSIDMANKSARLDALFYLCQVTVPKLWPEVYSNLFRPARVIALEEQRGRVIARRREELADIERQIQEELDFYAPHTNLPWVGGDELKGRVAEAFEKVFGFSVKDLDAELEEGQPKTLDLFIGHGNWSAMVEVRGSSNRNARTEDLEKLDDNYELAREAHGATDSKLLVFNGMHGRDVEERRQRPTFSQRVVDEAHTRGIALLTTEELLKAIEAHRNDEMTVEQFVEALGKPGLFVPPWEG